MTDQTTSASPVSSLPPTAEPTPFIRQRPVRIIINSFLALFVVALIAFRFVPGWLDPDFSKHIESHRVMVGMDRKQVLDAWGSPNTMNFFRSHVIDHNSDIVTKVSTCRCNTIEILGSEHER